MRGDTRTVAQRMNRQENVTRWVELKIQGHSYRAIAKLEGYSSHGHIQQAVEAELAKVPLESTIELKKVMLDQIDADMIRLDKIIDGSGWEDVDEEGNGPAPKDVTAAISTRAKLRDQKAKLMGTYAPEQVITSVTVTEGFSAEIEKARALAESMKPQQDQDN